MKSYLIRIKSLITILIAGVSYLMVCSYQGGAGTSGWDCTGAETGLGNVSGCRSCHGSSATTSLSVSLELDSAGVPVSQYVGGGVYTVTLTGTNNSTFTLPRYGFQIGCMQGSVSVTTPVNEGAFSGVSSGTHIANPSSGNYVLRMVEQTASQTPVSGTGGAGTVYAKTFTWTAPAAGTGTVSFWAVLNAVNGNGSASSADKWNTTHLVINEQSNTTGFVSPVVNNYSIIAVPNPFSDRLCLNYRSDIAANGKVTIFDLQGRKIYSQDVESNPAGSTMELNTTEWPSGIYQIVLEKDGNRSVSKAIKL